MNPAVNETASGQSARVRLLAVGLSFGFVLVSVACHVLLWVALSFLGEESIVRNTVVGALSLFAIVALTILMRRQRPGLERRDLTLLPSASLGSVKLAALGLLAGSVLFGLVFILVSLTGGISVTWRPVDPLPLVGSLLGVLVATILSAAWEEFTFRGWAFSACAKALGAHTIALSLGAAFGLAHLFNPNWTLAAIVSVALAGFLLSYAMLASRNIMVPIGLHVGWNFTQTLLTSSRFWEVTRHPDPLISGGEWGLEGSAVGIGVTAVGAGLALVGFVVMDRRARAQAS